MMPIFEKKLTLNLNQLQRFKQNCYLRAAQQPHACLLDSHGCQTPYTGTNFEFIYGEGIFKKASNQPQALDWENKLPILGYIGYDYKQQTLSVPSNNPPIWHGEESCFFEPLTALFIKENELSFKSYVQDAWQDFEHFLAADHSSFPEKQKNTATFTQDIDAAHYIETVKKIKNDIREGLFYELNYCWPFQIQMEKSLTGSDFYHLSQTSPSPFGAFLKLGENHISCMSMERFFCKKGRKVYSQPIKGTIKRGHHPEEETALKKQLLDSEKERAENLMIVDLVRNDLAMICDIGTVTVEELFGIYPFAQVFQMISTVSGQLPQANFPTEKLLSALFPMGSMTGAPKRKAVEKIEDYENFKRGPYSGSIGYIMPNGDADFNVVIRSLLYNDQQKNAAIPVGSAITYDAIPEEELKECRLKIKALLRFFDLA